MSAYSVCLSRNAEHVYVLGPIGDVRAVFPNTDAGLQHATARCRSLNTPKAKRGN